MRLTIVTFALIAASAHGQSYTCPDEPTWAAVPCSMHEAIQPTDWEGRDLTLVYTKPGGRRAYVVTAGSSTARFDWSFEELLTHELCHVIDSRSDLRNAQGWLDAVEADGDARVTDYAENNEAEDFAESCAAHILLGVGHRLTDAHREHVEGRIPNRLAYLDTLFPRWSDELAVDPVER